MKDKKPFTLVWWLKIYDSYVSSMHAAQDVYGNQPLYEKNAEKVKWIR